MSSCQQSFHVTLGIIKHGYLEIILPKSRSVDEDLVYYVVVISNLLWKLFACAGREVVEPLNYGRKNAVDILRSSHKYHGVSSSAYR